MAAINRFGDTGKVYNIRVRGLYGCRICNDNEGCAAFFRVLLVNACSGEHDISDKAVRHIQQVSSFFLYGLIALQSVIFKCEAGFLKAVG